MAGNLTAMIASIFSGSAVTADPYYEYTTLLLPGNGTNGAQNNTFLDGSTNNFTITRNGNTTQGTFSPFSQTGWGNYFSGTGAYLTVNDNAGSDLDLGSGQFSVEFWWYPQSSSAGQYPLIGDSTGNWYVIWDNNAGSNAISLGRRGQANDVNTTGFTLATNTWQQVVVTRQSTGTNDTRIFVNGVLRGIGTSSQNYTITTTLGIGGTSTGTNLINGYLSNVRIVKGSVPADYQTSSTSTGTTIFTPPTSPLTAVSGTTFLTCQSNRFVDNSATPKTITVNGTTSVQAFSPFNPTASWSAATNGGSGYFDGSGDYLQLPAGTAFAPGTGDFTVDGWFYTTVTTANQIIWSQAVSGTNYFIVWADPSTSTVYFNGTLSGGGVNISSTANLQVNAWNYFSVRRASGTVTVYLNGVAGTPTSNTVDFSNTSYVPTIGRYTHAATNHFTGYIANLRYVKGTAITPSGVPTTLNTAVSGTSALLNFTNAGIYDATSKNDLETVGNAQISTTQSKWGGSSIYVDGTGDRLFNGISSPLLNLSSGDWTIESWVYFNAVGTYAYVLNIATAPANPSGLVFGINNSSRIYIGNGAVLGTNGNTTLSTGQWYYLAAVKSGSNVTLYVNGTADVTPFAFTPNSGTYLYVGADASAGNQLNAYLQDVRITRYARPITASPTAAFPTL
jgi:hypothetical protein